MLACQAARAVAIIDHNLHARAGVASRRLSDYSNPPMKAFAIVPTLLLAFVLTGCSPSSAQSALPLVKVTKNPSCGCCKIWVERLRDAGFQVEVNDVDNLNSVKQRVGLPYGMGSCHTAEVGGYFVEGHVPVEDIKRLLRERPQARGLAVPGNAGGLSWHGGSVGPSAAVRRHAGRPRWQCDCVLASRRSQIAPPR